MRAIGLGAYDFFAKPFEPELLGLTIDRALRLAELQAENRRLQAQTQAPAMSGIVTRPGLRKRSKIRLCRTGSSAVISRQ